jgi:hypothetical protein
METTAHIIIVLLFIWDGYVFFKLVKQLKKELQTTNDVLETYKTNIEKSIDQINYKINELAEQLGYNFRTFGSGIEYPSKIKSSLESQQISAILEYLNCEIVSVPEKPEHFEIKKKD